MRIKRWFYTLPLRLPSLLRRQRFEQELDEELQHHPVGKMSEPVFEIVGGAAEYDTRHAAPAGSGMRYE